MNQLRTITLNFNQSIMNSINKMKKFKLNKYIIILILLIILHAILNYTILSIDNTYMIYDESNAHMFSLRIFNLVKSNPINLFYYFMNDQSTYPPLMHLASTPYYALLGTSQDIAAFNNITFFIILIFSTYGIGKTLFNKNVGLLSAIIVSFFPGIFAFSRVYMVDFPLASMVTLSWYFLLKTKKFTDTKYSLLFGLSAGLGMLAKFTYFIYILPYFIFLLPWISGFFKQPYNQLNSKQKKARLFNLSLALIVCLSISSFWYFFNLKRTFLHFLAANKAYFLKTHLNYNFWFIIKRFNLILFILLKQINLSFFIIFLLSLIYAIFNFKKIKISYLLLWFFIPILFISMNTFWLSKRFILPVLPAVAILISFFLFRTFQYVKKIFNIKKTKHYWEIFLGILILMCLFGYFRICFPAIYLGDANEGFDFADRSVDDGMLKPAVVTQTPYQIIALLNLSEPNKKISIKENILIIPDTPLLTETCNQINMDYGPTFYEPLKDVVYECKPLTLCIVAGFNFCDDIELGNISTMESYFKNANIIITKNNGTFGFEHLSYNTELMEQFVKPMLNLQEKYITNFSLIYKSEPNPRDNYSIILIYKRLANSEKS